MSDGLSLRRNPEFPTTFCPTDERTELAADGINPVVVWDGKEIPTEPDEILWDNAGVEAPDDTITMGTAGAGLLSGVYRAAERFIDNLGHVSNWSPLSDTLGVTGGTLLYSTVPIPAQGKVVRRQILRNTNGNFTTFYVDIDTTNLSDTTFTSNQPDSSLSLNTAVPVSQAFLNGPPPSNKAVMVNHKGRIFAAVEVIYRLGHVKTTNGSDTVLGFGTDWSSAMTSKQFFVVGDGGPGYEISTINPTVQPQVMVLTENYEGTSNTFAKYTIVSPPAFMRSVDYSEAGLPESWPATNSFTVQETNDEITGLLSLDGYLFILERGHVHRLSFNSDPSDATSFLSKVLDRGCINQRCWVQVESEAYMLDQAGIHVFNGQTSVDVGVPIQDVFRRNPTFGQSINWNASRWFHAAHSPDEQVIRFYVAIGDAKFPRHALAFNYRQKRWWEEELAVDAGDSCTGHDTSLRLACFVGSECNRVIAIGAGFLDGPQTNGTVRGDVTEADHQSFSDSAAVYASDFEGTPVAIVRGKGKGQLRIVTGDDTANAGRLLVEMPWTTTPDDTSVYQLGGFTWDWRSTTLRWQTSEQEKNRRFSLLFQPITIDSRTDVHFLNDRLFTEDTIGYSRTEDGLGVTEGRTYVQINHSQRNGYVQVMRPSAAWDMENPCRFVTVEMAGFNCAAAQRIFEIDIDGIGQ